MGTYGSVCIHIEEGTTVDVEKIREIEELFNEKHQDEVGTFIEIAGEKYNISDSCKMVNVKFTLDENKLVDIDAPSYCGLKIREGMDDVVFASKLSEAVKNGQIIIFYIADDPRFWAYIVKPGKVVKIDPEKMKYF
jgi:hypothetical protein